MNLGYASDLLLLIALLGTTEGSTGGSKKVGGNFLSHLIGGHSLGSKHSGHYLYVNTVPPLQDIYLSKEGDPEEKAINALAYAYHRCMNHGKHAKASRANNCNLHMQKQHWAIVAPVKKLLDDEDIPAEFDWHKFGKAIADDEGSRQAVVAYLKAKDKEEKAGLRDAVLVLGGVAAQKDDPLIDLNDEPVDPKKDGTHNPSPKQPTKPISGSKPGSGDPEGSANPSKSSQPEPGKQKPSKPEPSNPGSRVPGEPDEGDPEDNTILYIGIGAAVLIALVAVVFIVYRVAASKGKF